MCVRSCWTAWSQSYFESERAQFSFTRSVWRSLSHAHSRSSLPQLPHLSAPKLWEPRRREGAGLYWLWLTGRGGKRQRSQMFWESLPRYFSSSACSVTAASHFKVEFVSERGKRTTEWRYVCGCMCARQYFSRHGGIIISVTRGKARHEKTLYYSTNFWATPWRECLHLAVRTGGK